MSQSIDNLINEVDKTFVKEIATAKNDYKVRIDAANKMFDTVKMPDIIIEMGNTSRQKLADGAIGEAMKAQKAAGQNMEKALDKAINTMEDLKGDPANAKSIIRLTEKLEDWIIQFEELSIPASSHTKAVNFNASTKYEDQLKKWQNYCKNDPVMKKAELYERKNELEAEIKSLREKKIELESAIPKKEAELEDRKSNEEKYVEAVKEQQKNELEEIDTKIRRIDQEVHDTEYEINNLKQQLSKLGLFSGGKKKDIKSQIETKTSILDKARKTLDEHKAERQHIEGSLDKQIAELKTKINSLKEEITAAREELETVNNKAISDNEELIKINEQINLK